MSFEATILAIILIGATGIFALSPFFARSADPDPSPYARRGTPRQRQALETLWAEKQRVLRSIRDLDFDYDLDKLTDPAYAAQRIALIRLYAAIVLRMDEIEAELDQQEQLIEQAVAAMRRADQTKSRLS